MSCRLSCSCGGVFRHTHETRRQFILVCDKCENVILTDKVGDPSTAYQPLVWKEKNYVIRSTKPVT
jgi:hypothetical protein